MPSTVVCRDMDDNKTEESVDNLSWRPAAYGIVVKDGAVLLLKQYNGYDLPGGGIDFGETSEEAVIREILEESGLTAANPKLIDVATSYFRFPHTGPLQCLSLYYSCEYVSGQIHTDGLDEHEKNYAPEGCEWVPIDQLEHIPIAASTDWRPLILRDN